MDLVALSSELLSVLPNGTREAFSESKLQEAVGKQEIYFWYDEVIIPTEGMYIRMEDKKIIRLFPVTGKGTVGIYEGVKINDSSLEKKAEEIQTALETLPYIKDIQMRGRFYNESAEAYAEEVQFSFCYSEIRKED